MHAVNTCKGTQLLVSLLSLAQDYVLSFLVKYISVEFIVMIKAILEYCSLPAVLHSSLLNLHVKLKLGLHGVEAINSNWIDECLLLGELV